MTPGESSSEDDAVSVVGDQLTDVGLLSAGVWVFCGVPWGAVSEDQVPPIFPCFWVCHSLCLSLFPPSALSLHLSFPGPPGLVSTQNTCWVCILAGAGA